MAPNDRARHNHDLLFPNHVSTWAATDPELIDVFDNFAFGEVLQERAGRAHPADGPARSDHWLAGGARVPPMLAAALNVGVTPVEAKEIVYQAVPYIGLAKVFDFIHVTNDVLTERGVKLPLPAQSSTTPEDRLAKGLEVQKQIVGDELVEGLYASASPDQQHLQRFLSANCFGDWVARGGDANAAAAVMANAGYGEFGKVMARGGSGVVISSQSGHRLPALTVEQNKALAMTPTDGTGTATSPKCAPRRGAAWSNNHGDRKERITAVGQRPCGLVHGIGANRFTVSATGAGARRRRNRDLRTCCPHRLAHASTRADADRHGRLWTRAARRRTDRGDPRG